MGFLTALSKAFDAVDGAAAQAIASHSAQKEAARFAATVKPGRTYYTQHTHHLPWGDEVLLKEWVFAGSSIVIRQPMCGHMTAAAVWLGYGPVFDKRPAGVQTVDEYSAQDVGGPKTGSKRGAKAGRR